ncbi:MAG: hypothetical protein CMC78_05540 [Flavobacteriaceae bacterium]|jgi:hypothetical protein|nr:hypothetical protein [Flavobacteriaceae bacterium]|tara:strand:- start:945 stop:1556 length:612 start_codon:yes stop_codon:yes gene_type:complete
MSKIKENSGVLVQGHIKIHDPESGAVFVNKRNAIHYENMSIALAESVANQGQGFISSMAFGNGGTSVDPTGIITYLTPNSTGTNASLYNQTFTKIVDDRSVSNLDPQRNKIETRHVNGTNYTDVVVTCLLDYGEPNGQDATDTASASDSLYVFDELGLTSYASSGTGKLLTHVIFHPVQKSLNRLIQIDYTVRVQSLTGFNEG